MALDLFLLSVGMILCISLLFVLKIAEQQELFTHITRESQPTCQEKRRTALWKVSLHKLNGELVFSKKGQYLNDMLDLVRSVVISEDYSTEENYIVVEFD